MVSLQFASVLVALVACGVGTFTDIRKGIIPNWLTLPALVIGLAIGFVDGSWWGMGMSLASALATAMVPLILFRMNAMGGGDVKLFAAIGALLGIDLALQVLMASCMLGALWGVSLWIVRGELPQRLKMAFQKVVPVRWLGFRIKRQAMPQTFIKFGPAILAGCVLTVGLHIWEMVRHGG